ncbi:MAG: SGNH/GDSL hydrolase family protein [Spirochaetales bacterium]|nr:SGNH/GDSL hydrolase family protein [Spirochaetales bacterium]
MREIVHNALFVEERDRLHFARRFSPSVETELQRHALYQAMGRTSASVQLRFLRTGPVTLTIKRFSASLRSRPGQIDFSRRYGGPLNLSETLDIEVDGLLFHNPLRTGVIRFTEGEEITIHLPNHHEVGWTLEGSFEPVERKAGTLLCLGDSIIQGVGVHHGSEGLCTRLGSILEMEVLNQGLAGTLVNPRMVVPLQKKIDCILLGYGTNDWSLREDRNAFIDDVRQLFARLRALYPLQPIVLVTPLYRADHDRIRPLGSFEEIGSILGEAASRFENVTVLDGVSLSLRDRFDDGFLHPNAHFIAHLARQVADRFPSGTGSRS